MPKAKSGRVKLEKFVLPKFRRTPNYKEVEGIAEKLLEYLNKPKVFKQIDNANQPRNSSSKVQDVVIKKAQELGFESEKKGLFLELKSGLRPDYFMGIGKTGILVEVERGKTTTNNMDLLDFWKCHLCKDASHLFLLVPIELRHNNTDPPKKAFDYVKNRLKKFFDPENKTNVRSLFLFGY